MKDYEEDIILLALFTAMCLVLITAFLSYMVMK